MDYYLSPLLWNIVIFNLHMLQAFLKVSTFSERTTSCIDKTWQPFLPFPRSDTQEKLWPPKYDKSFLVPLVLTYSRLVINLSAWRCCLVPWFFDFLWFANGLEPKLACFGPSLRSAYPTFFCLPVTLVHPPTAFCIIYWLMGYFGCNHNKK